MGELNLRKKRVCVDLDGTLLSYDGWKGVEHFGAPLPGAVEFTRELSRFADVIIFTCRCSEDCQSESAEFLTRRVREFLDREGFAYSEIYTGRGKPFAHAYIDDRSIVCDPQSWVGPEVSFRSALMSARALCRHPAENDSP